MARADASARAGEWEVFITQWVELPVFAPRDADRCLSKLNLVGKNVFLRRAQWTNGDPPQSTSDAKNSFYCHGS